MKTSCLARLVAASLACTALATVGCAKSEKVAAAAPSPTPPPTAAPENTVVATWSDIKDLAYDSRADFFAGLKRLEAVVDGQVAELTARRAAMKSTIDTREWDFAIKEMNNARTSLLGAGEEAGKATVETWAQQKEKVGQAWERTQQAYAKVKASTSG